MTTPPVVLTIAGSDNSCGAGLQADLKTITSLGGYAQTAVTCVVAEVPGAVEMIQPVKPAVVAAQVRLLRRKLAAHGLPSPIETVPSRGYRFLARLPGEP